MVMRMVVVYRTTMNITVCSPHQHIFNDETFFVTVVAVKTKLSEALLSRLNISRVFELASGDLGRNATEHSTIHRGDLPKSTLLKGCVDLVCVCLYSLGWG